MGAKKKQLIVQLRGWCSISEKRGKTKEGGRKKKFVTSDTREEKRKKERKKSVVGRIRTCAGRAQ